MGRLKRWWYLSKLLTSTITIFNFFDCPVKLWRNLKLKFRSKFDHHFTNYGYMHSAVWKAWWNFKIKRAQEARHNQFFFQNVQNNEIFETLKCLKRTAELAFTTQKLNTCSPWTACSVFNWKYLFWVNLVQKLKIIKLSLNFVPRLIQICRIPWWCSRFLFLTGNTFLGKSGPENQNCQSELKSCSRLVWICRIK